MPIGTNAQLTFIVICQTFMLIESTALKHLIHHTLKDEIQSSILAN